MNTLISVSQLAVLADSPNLLIFDCRFSLADPTAGYKAWQQGHIPGACYADLNRQLSAPHLPGRTGRHPLPDKAQWQHQVQQWGIHPAIQVVLYDDAGGAIAARMWWMLQWLGHTLVAVLDGGLQAWQAAGLPVDTAVPAPRSPAHFDYSTLPSLTTLIAADAVDGSRQLLLDAREGPRFRGEVEPIDPVAGHIPGAYNSPLSANLEEGRFRSAPALQVKFAGVSQSKLPCVCYCGSGVTACHNILAMRIAGLPMAALYPGSWSEWITDPVRPVAVGE